MRSMKLTGLVLLACLPIAAFAVSTAPIVGERSLREECSASSQAAMRDCLEKNAESSQRALRQAEEMVESTLSKWDEDHKFIKKAKANLAASNKRFARYRDAECAFVSSLGGGAIGNALAIRRLACISELNDRRAEQLRDAVSDLPLK